MDDLNAVPILQLVGCSVKYLSNYIIFLVVQKVHYSVSKYMLETAGIKC